MRAEQPIGIFDSGVGGLTVAHAIKSHLPEERIIYFGDTFHLPYGDKSVDSVRYYSRRISDFLLEKECKVVLIACNTASSSAYEEVVSHVAGRAIVVNVVDPVVEEVARSHDNGKVGVIGTKGTINSGTYEKKLKKLAPSMQVSAMATPLLVPMIEEGFIFDDISNAIVRTYLSDASLKDIDTLILGCTHYPIIRRQIEKYYNFNVEVIDSGLAVAGSLRNILKENGLLSKGQKDLHEFYVSDLTSWFEKIARIFFEEEIRLKLLNFWK
jgi:glutamate racemase